MGFGDIPPFLTPKQLSELTGMHVDTIRRGIREGSIPADKICGVWLIGRDVVFRKTKEALER